MYEEAARRAEETYERQAQIGFSRPRTVVGMPEHFICDHDQGREQYETETRDLHHANRDHHSGHQVDEPVGGVAFAKIGEIGTLAVVLRKSLDGSKDVALPGK